MTIDHPLGGPNCGMEMEEGGQWLIFSDEGYYDICNPGGPIENFSAEELEALRDAAQ